MVPNVLRAYAFAPEKLRAFRAMHDDLMLAESVLTKLEREMVAVVVSAVNRRWRRLVAHGAAVRRMSGDLALGETMRRNWRVADLTPRQHAMLAFAARMTKASGRIGETDRQALRDVGLSDGDIWDLAALAGFFNRTNRTASATGMVPNAEHHAQDR